MDYLNLCFKCLGTTIFMILQLLLFNFHYQEILSLKFNLSDEKLTSETYCYNKYKEEHDMGRGLAQ